MNNNHSPIPFISRMQLALAREQKSIEQLKLEKEIEAQGIFYKWSDVGRTSKPTNLKNLTIVRYKDTKIQK